MKKVGIILNGCGSYDGTEIHEAVLTLLALNRKGVQAICLAPNKNQTEVINHFNKNKMIENRNTLIESARIARGAIRELSASYSDELDALIIPGGLGITKNLSNFFINKDTYYVDSEFSSLVKNIHYEDKPLGLICIAPVLLLKIFDFPLKLTIGTDTNISKIIEKMGSEHVLCQANNIVIDEKNKIVTTPAYMLTQNIAEVAEGIEKLVNQVLIFTK